MPKRLTQFAFLILLTLSVPQRAEAGLWSFTALCAEHFKHFSVRNFSLPLSDKDLEGTFRETNEKVHLSFGKRLGYGFVGGVYEVEVTHADGTKQDLVGKSVHRYRVFGQLGFQKTSLRAEVKQRDDLIALLPALRKNKKYPKDAAWPANGIPLGQIIGIVKTKKGDVLLKRKLKGMTVEDFGREHAKSPPDFMPPEMEASLKEMHAFVDAVYEESGKVGKPVLLDLNPNNLVWVTDAKLLAEMGFSRPSFVAFEMTEGAPAALTSTWAEFKQTYLEYSRHAFDSSAP